MASIRPESVSILGTDFRIRYTDKMEDRWAEADGDNRVISVNNTLRGDRLKFYLLHEYLHAILHVSGHTARFKTSEEEALVSALTHGLAPLIELDTSVKT